MSKEDVKKNILDKISKGEVEMRPKWHFVLKTILVVTGTVILALGLLYILSFIVFAMRQSGVFFTPAFGFRGIAVFLYSSPWILILLAIIFIITLEVLVRKYSFVYRRPVVYILLGIVAISLLGTYFVSQTPLHTKVKDFAEHRNMRPIGAVYDMYSKPAHRDVHVGIILEVKEEGLLLENRKGEQLNVILWERTRIPPVPVKENDTVMVMGKRNKNEIVAEGVKPLPEDVRFIRQGEGKMMEPRPEVQGKWKRMKENRL